MYRCDIKLQVGCDDQSGVRAESKKRVEKDACENETRENVRRLLTSSSNTATCRTVARAYFQGYFKVLKGIVEPFN